MDTGTALRWEPTDAVLPMFQELQYFDRSTVTEEKLLQLCRIVHSPQFVPELVREVSRACESLCHWVLAVYEYCSMQHKLVIMRELEMLAKESRVQLHIAKQQKEDRHTRLEEVMNELWLVQTELEAQLIKLHKAEDDVRAAMATLEEFEKHGTRWKALTEVTYSSILRFSEGSHSSRTSQKVGLGQLDFSCEEASWSSRS